MIYPLPAKQVFARAYLEAHGSGASDAEVGELLWDIERCMPLGLISFASFFAHLGLDTPTPVLTTAAERALVLVEAAASDKAAQRQIVEQGVANIAMDWGVNPVDRLWLLTL